MAGRNKAARTGPAGASDEQVRALLDRYQCPVAFHEVRTRFLGNIATPSMVASPIKMIQDLWGGELPVFGSIDAANELIGALIMGLWNRLTRHQDRNTPFRLNRIETAATREGLADLSRMRVQEIDGFVAGLFGREDRIDLPERALIISALDAETFARDDETRHRRRAKPASLKWPIEGRLALSAALPQLETADGCRIGGLLGRRRGGCFRAVQWRAR